MTDLDRHGDHFPLGAAPEVEPEQRGLRAFGLRYGTPPRATVDLDFERISYDADRQIAVVIDDDGTTLPAMRHTSTQTTTSTNAQDRGSPDSDTDATGT